MAEAKTIAQFNTFVGGLITESTELTYPPNSSADELNCEIFTKGNRTRRKGVDYEIGYELSSFSVTQTNLETFAISTHRWNSVAGDGDTNFVVVQLGSTLYFYDTASDSISSGEKSFTVDLENYLAPAASTASTSTVNIIAGRGDLFVVSPLIEPIRISYLEDTDDISIEQVEMGIRDFEGVDDGLEVDEEPTTLSSEHSYNLKNQGWYVTPFGNDNIQIYRDAQGVYPSNNMQWHLAVKVRGESIGGGESVTSTTQGQVNSYALRKLSLGTTEVPKGHYILNPFRKDRSSVSGVAGLPVESTDQRPGCVGFFAGRVCYGFQGDVYISQVLNRRRDNAGKFYQEADPTSEDISDLVDTDGMVIPIPEAGSILALSNVGPTLLVFANNGVWAISGTDGGFKATDFSVSKVTNSGILSRTGLVNAEGTLIWWSDSGIFTIQQDKVTGGASAINLTDPTIKTFYLDINPESRAKAVGKYDPSNQTITWLYKEGVDQASPHGYNKVLRFNIGLGSFYPWEISGIEGTTPFVAGIVDLPSLSKTFVQETLYDSEDNVITTSIGEIVTFTTTGFSSSSSFIKYLCVVPDPEDEADTKITFGEFTNTSLTDWETYGIMNGHDGGAEYTSFVETGHDLQGDLARDKQAPYVILHAKRTETGYNVDTEEWTNPSSVYVRGKWDFSDNARSGKWTISQQGYKILNKDIPTETTASYDYGNRVLTSRIRVRGRGRALQLRFESEGNKDFNILGWGIVYTGTTTV